MRTAPDVSRDGGGDTALGEDLRQLAGRCALVEAELVEGRWPRRADRQLRDALRSVVEAARRSLDEARGEAAGRGGPTSTIDVQDASWAPMGDAAHRFSMLGSCIVVNGAQLGLIAIEVEELADGRLRAAFADDAAALDAMLESFDVGGSRYATARLTPGDASERSARYALFAAPLPEPAPRAHEGV